MRSLISFPLKSATRSNIKSNLLKLSIVSEKNYGNNSCSRGRLAAVLPNKLPTSSSPLMYPPLPLSIHIHLVRKHYKLVASALHPISIGQNPKYLYPYLKVFVFVNLQRMLENKYKDIKQCLQILLLYGVLLPF